MILLYTHVAIWVLRNDSALGRKARDLIAAASGDNKLAISAISFWEIALLIAKRRLRSLDDPAETRRLILLTGIHELPLTGEIALLAAQRRGLHDDPVDRFIAATAIAHRANLMTADDALLGWKANIKRIDAER